MAKGGKERYVYRGGDRTVESVVRRSKQSGSSYDSYINPDIPFFKPREGECSVRILPRLYEDDKEAEAAIARWGDGWEIGVHMHRNVGPDNATYLCLDKMQGTTCPVCEAKRQASDPDEADALRVQWRALCWVIDRDNEKAGPQVWSMPISLFRDINARSVDKKTGKPILIDDPEEGYDLIFNREGQKKRTKYVQVEVSRDPTPIHDDERQQERWLSYIADNALPDILNFYDAAHIESILFGRADREEDEDDRRGRRASRRGRDDDRETDEEEEERGSRRRGRGDDGGRASSRRGREDDEDDRPSRRGRGRDDTEEEEDAQPRSRRGRGSEEDTAEEEPRRGGRRGGGKGDDDEEEEEERPTRSRSRDKDGDDDNSPSPRRRGAREEEPEEEERSSRRRPATKDEEEESGEEEEEAPSSRRRPTNSERAGSRRGDVEEDPDPEDDDDGKESSVARRKLEGLRNRRR